MGSRLYFLDKEEIGEIPARICLKIELQFLTTKIKIRDLQTELDGERKKIAELIDEAKAANDILKTMSARETTLRDELNEFKEEMCQLKVSRDKSLEMIKSCLSEWEAINKQDSEIKMTVSERQNMELVVQNRNSLSSSGMQSDYTTVESLQVTITDEEHELLSKELPELRYSRKVRPKFFDGEGGQDASRENASSLTGESEAMSSEEHKLFQRNVQTRNTFGVKGDLPKRVAIASPSKPNTRGHKRRKAAQLNSIISSHQSRDRKEKMTELSPPTDEINNLESFFTSSRVEARSEASQLVVAKKTDNDVPMNSETASREESSYGFSSEDSIEPIKRVKQKRYHAERPFHFRETLDLRMLMDKGERFQCTVCSKAYTQKRQLDLHMRTHTKGQEPFDR